MKKLLLIIAALILVTTTCYSANTQTSANTSTERYEEASVDTDPGAAGYGCKPVSIQYTRGLDAEEMRFYIKSITGATVTLQWKRAADASWTDYEDYTEVTRKIIRDNSAGMYWRAIVKDDAQGTSSVFGIDW